MNQNSHSTGSTLHQSNINTGTTRSDQGELLALTDGYHTTGSHYDSGTFSANHERYNNQFRSANELSQYHACSKLEEDSNSVPYGNDFYASPLPASRDDWGLLCSIESQAMMTHSNIHSPGLWNNQTENQDTTRSYQNLPDGPDLGRRGSSATTHFIQEPTIEFSMQAKLEEGYKTKFEPFRSLFDNSEAARDYRRVATRFDREPYFDPSSDPTISEIEFGRLMHVERIYNAMIRGDKARDNPGSIAVKRWVIEAQYPPNLVEAIAHKVFDILMSQVKYGFRGWVHNDYVADERKGEDIDKDVDCAGRLDNIILALEQEKTICEDVMNSACQIRMFVNAPKAYANRKQQNRVGNSKRRKRDTSEPVQAVKSRRTGARQTRPRSSTLSESTPLTAIHEQPLAYHQRVRSSSLLTTDLAPRSTPLNVPIKAMPHPSFDQHSVTAISPPVSSPQQPIPPQSQIPRMTIAPPPMQSPFLSPPQNPNDLYPTQSTPVKADSAYPWLQEDALFGESSHSAAPQQHNLEQAVDPMLSFWGPGDDAFMTNASGGADMFDAHSSVYVNLADVEGLEFAFDPKLQNGEFQGVWRG